MTRWFAASLSLLAVTAHASDWGKRSEEFRRAAMAERKKLGLDKDEAKLRAEYPTPELKFAAGAKCLVLCPGEAKVVKLEGRFGEKGLVGSQSDEVTLSNDRASAKGWEGTVTVKPSAPPRSVGLDALSPVSAVATYVEPVVIGCKHTWSVDAEGVTLSFKSEFSTCEARVPAAGDWKKGGKALGAGPLELSRTESGLRVERTASQEEMMAQAKAGMAFLSSPEMQALSQRRADVVAKMNKCGNGPPAQMAKCFEGPKAGLDALSKEQDALQATFEKKNAPAFGCRTYELEAADGKLTGEATGCAGHRSADRVALTGKYSAP